MIWKEFRALAPTWLAAAAAMIGAEYISSSPTGLGGPVYFIVSSATIVDTLWDSQRRRKPVTGKGITP